MPAGFFSNLFKKTENKEDQQVKSASSVHLRALEPTQQNIAQLKNRFTSVSIKAENKAIKEFSAINYIHGIASGAFHETVNETMDEKGLLEDFIVFLGDRRNTVFCFFDLMSAEILRDAFKWNNMSFDGKYLVVGDMVKRLYPYRNEKTYTPTAAYSYFGSLYAKEAEHLSPAECVGKIVCLIISDEHMSAALSKYNTFSRKKPERTEILNCNADLDTDYLDIGMEVTMEYSPEKRRNVLTCNTRFLCVADERTISAASQKTNRKIIFITDIRRTKKNVLVTVNIYPDLPALPFGFEDKQRYRVDPRDAVFRR